MKIVSIENNNENTNTLTLNINGMITVRELLDSAEALRFAPALSASAILTIDGADTEIFLNQLDSMLDLQLTDDSIVEITCFGEVKASAAKVQGSVTVELGGEGVKRKMIIMSGETTVSQVLTSKLAAAFGRSHSELLNMQVFVNDAKAEITSVLYDGDSIVLQERKAGSGACDGEHEVLFIDVTGDEDYMCADSNATLRCFLEHIAPELFGGESVVAHVTAINGESVCSGLVYEMALDNLKMGQIDALEFDLEFPEDLNYEDAEADADDEEAPLTADGVVAAKAAPGKVYVHLEGTSIESPTDSVTLMIVNNKTTVEEVVFTSKVLNKLAMTSAHMREMNFAVNDVNIHNLDATLQDGDVITIKTPKCGSGACC